MFAQYFEYYAIILRGAVFLWTQCTLSRVPRHFSMLSTFHVQLCALISRFLLCSDVTMLQSSSPDVSTCSSSAETFTSRPTSAHTLQCIRYPLSLCSATYMLHRRALHPVAYETFASAVTLYHPSCRNFFAYETSCELYIYFVVSATRHAL